MTTPTHTPEMQNDEHEVTNEERMLRAQIERLLGSQSIVDESSDAWSQSSGWVESGGWSSGAWTQAVKS